MGEALAHECGIALLVLRKPLEYYHRKYGSPFWGLNRLQILLEKQHNRGQDGAGIGVVALDKPPGQPFMFRRRSTAAAPLLDIFSSLQSEIARWHAPASLTADDITALKARFPFLGEIMLGHLRYGTHAESGVEFCHPFVHRSHWMSRNLMLAGNFNMANNEELFQKLVELGQHPPFTNDTLLILERFVHYLDRENNRIYQQYYEEGLTRRQISERLRDELDLRRVIQDVVKGLDGGYVIGGVVGHGDAFVVRDPHGIRPAYYYEDDEVVAVASERPPLRTAFHRPFEAIHEVPAGHAMIVDRRGRLSFHRVADEAPLRRCSFEHIYFSRGNDEEVYQSRKRLGHELAPRVLEALGGDITDTVFSYIPNTAEVAFLGMVEQIRKHQIEHLLRHTPSPTPDQWLAAEPRIEKLAVKDTKIRTFIAQENGRNDLVQYVYDVTYRLVRPGKDRIVVVDDSIVRGTTLRESIIRILARLQPAQILIVSSAPPIRFPDCYGIDMAKLHDLVAFQAAIDILHETGREQLIEQVYDESRRLLDRPRPEATYNPVKRIYEAVDDENLFRRIARLVTPSDVDVPVHIIYQTLEGLHRALPHHRGDWYFTGDYPTPGGNRVACRAFVNFYEKRDERAYV